jgi:hypothetical protein
VASSGPFVKKSENRMTREPTQLSLPLTSIEDEKREVDHLKRALHDVYETCSVSAQKWEELMYDIEHSDQLKEMWESFQFTRKMITTGTDHELRKKKEMRRFDDHYLRSSNQNKKKQYDFDGEEMEDA